MHIKIRLLSLIATFDAPAIRGPSYMIKVTIDLLERTFCSSATWQSVVHPCECVMSKLRPGCKHRNFSIA